jgi:putative endonuclease
MTSHRNEHLLRLYDDQSKPSCSLHCVTNVIERRLRFHRNVSPRSFTKRYNVDRLVYYERFDRARDAISGEKEIKGWPREKKNDLLQTLNPKWEDLGEKLFGGRK